MEGSGEKFILKYGLLGFFMIPEEDANQDHDAFLVVVNWPDHCI